MTGSPDGDGYQPCSICADGKYSLGDKVTTCLDCPTTCPNCRYNPTAHEITTGITSDEA